MAGQACAAMTAYCPARPTIAIAENAVMSPAIVGSTHLHVLMLWAGKWQDSVCKKLRIEACASQQTL